LENSFFERENRHEEDSIGRPVSILTCSGLLLASMGLDSSLRERNVIIHPSYHPPNTHPCMSAGVTALMIPQENPPATIQREKIMGAT